MVPKYRIDLVWFGHNVCQTIDNFDDLMTQDELDEYMDDWFSECNSDRDEFEMYLVEQETGEIILKAY